jgi:hypothetical protein
MDTQNIPLVLRPEKVNFLVHLVVGFEAVLSTPSLRYVHVRFMKNGVALGRVSF